MDILFLQNIWFESLGTMSLLAVAKKAGFQADVVIGKDKELLRTVRNLKPRIVGFSCVTGIQNWALNLCQKIKADVNPQIITFMGGPHPTFFPEVLLENTCLDLICTGEGEHALLDVLKAQKIPDDLQTIQNIHVRNGNKIRKNPVRPLIKELDTLPFVDRESLYRYPLIRDNPLKRLISSRGCPHNCSFCFNHSMKNLYKGKGTYVRRRSVDNVIEEMKYVQSCWPVTTFLFEDDLFAVNKNWLMEFCEKYPVFFKEHFICYVRADSVDREAVKALKEAGCYNVVIGVETGDEMLRNEVLNKNITDEQLRAAAALFHEFKINFCTTNILGLPSETPQQAFRTMSFTWDLNPTFTWCSVFQPYPRTRLGDMVEAEKLVQHLDVDSIEPNYHSNSVLNQPDIKLSVNLHKFFYVLFNYPALFSVIKPFLRLPPNMLFTMIHRVSFLLIYRKRWKISLWRAIREAMNTSGFTRKRLRRIDTKSGKIETN
jgi:anaerobic magnesium-protoporphyrin IX monomethyl ester cyclase